MASGLFGGIFPTKAEQRLIALCALFGVASFIWGYNIGIMAPIYVHPGFVKALHKPTSSKKGLITAIYYLGTWVSYVFLSHRVSDRFGRRGAAGSGILIVCVGAALQAGARGSAISALAMMIIGRIICGVGVSLVSTSVPMYQSECAPAYKRGKYVVMNHIGMVAGLAAAFWVGYGMTFWEDSARGKYYGWRFSMLAQYIPAIIFLVGLPFSPESPRWLVKKGQIERASETLQYLRDPDPSGTAIADELALIEANIVAYRPAEAEWTALFKRRPLFRRLWRASLLQFMAQMSGSTSIKYYLPTIFGALGINRQISLLIGGIESTLKIGCTIIEMFLVDHVGRRGTLLIGCALMSFSLLINGALPQAYPNNSNHAADYACVVFIFFYTFGFSIGFGPSAWVYGAEIFPTNFRAKGLNIAASGSSIGSIISSQAWPVGMDNIGSRTHFIFMSFNIASLIILYFFYPETKQRSMEDMDALFGGLDESTGAEHDGSVSAETEPEHETVPAKGQPV